MVDREEEERSPFDQWVERASQETQDRAQVEELTHADPVRESDIKAQLHEIGQDLGNAGVEHQEMTAEAQAELRTGTLETPPQNIVAANEFKQELQTKGSDAMIAEIGQTLNQTGVEVNDQKSPFEQWNQKAQEQTQTEPEQQQDQEPEQDR